MTDRAAWAKHLEAPLVRLRAHKYGAKARTVDGIRFDSTREAQRYEDLRILERAGLVADLEIHPRFPIDVFALRGELGTPIRCGVYTADFKYRETDTGAIVIEDVKSHPTRTTAYRLRKRLIEAIHGITIRELE